MNSSLTNKAAAPITSRQKKKKQINIHTVAAHGISMNTTSQTRLQLLSPYGKKENKPIFTQ